MLLADDLHFFFFWWMQKNIWSFILLLQIILADLPIFGLSKLFLLFAQSQKHC